MKKTVLLFAILLLINYFANAQSVSLSTTTANPTNGTVVYNNSTNQLQYWNGSAWVSLTNAIGTGWALNGTNIYKTNSGNVGIGVPNPGSKLQIGSMGSTGFFGNDIAFGNGTHATGIYQSDVSTTIASTNDIHLIPRANGGGVGLVGINTSAPRGPLDVNGTTDALLSSCAYFSYNSTNHQYAIGVFSPAIPPISIYAEQGILSTQFIAVSDARIKNIIGISNSVQDLAAVRALQITDYTMKDQTQYGNQAFKKVIAQQVEKVYPQAVSKVTDVVPDIYTLAEKVVFDEVNKFLICTLVKPCDIRVGEKLQFIHPTAGKIKAEVIEASGNSFTVKNWQHPTNKIFVYGREVNDFRSVDYEALSMLGISAIQQLAKENEELKKKNDEFSRKFEQLKSDLSARLEVIELQLPKTASGN